MDSWIYILAGGLGAFVGLGIEKALPAKIKSAALRFTIATCLTLLLAVLISLLIKLVM